MGFREFSRDEIESVLERERIVRLGFADGNDRFAVPVFYVWFDGALCGLTTPGRKTRLAEGDDRVAFQVDSTATTGSWTWSSVSGQGRFEVVREPAEFGPFAAKLRERLADAPEWAQQELQERFATLGMVPWRLRPVVISGRAHGPET